MSETFEANLDGLVGPTHNYAGLAFGNEASQRNAGQTSNPRAAALQGLEKMRLLMRLGIRQMVLPPQPRPDTGFLARLGFPGPLEAQIAAVAAHAPEWLAHCYSASAMWAANAATVTPGVDAADGKVHFTPANLVCTPHRAAESGFTARALKKLFPSPEWFVHHPPLPANLALADEGAANHMRLQGGAGGVHVFVYGRSGASPQAAAARYPLRQSLQASQAVARLHGVPPPRTLFVRQNARAIDAGVFHNDVIATSHENLLLYHEEAFAEGEAPVEALRRLAGGGLAVFRIAARELSVEAAVSTYLFNSQIVSTAKGMALIAPEECRENPRAVRVIERLLGDPACPLEDIHFMPLRESMRNGGGPACLRLRVPLRAFEWAAAHPGAVLTETLYESLKACIETHYRDRLAPQDLADPALAVEAHAALAALACILDMEDLYALPGG